MNMTIDHNNASCQPEGAAATLPVRQQYIPLGLAHVLWPSAVNANVLSSPVAEWISNCSSAQNYRRDYRSFRLGYAQGASGDTSEVAEYPFSSQPTSPKLEGTADYASANLDDDAARPLTLVTNWRLAYHRFRLGKSNGANGEIDLLAQELSKEALKYLPVYQLIQLRKKQRTKQEEVLRRQQQQPRLQSAPSFARGGIHVHFGSGKLGLGLVLNSLVERNRLPILIIQAPSRAPWKMLVDNTTVEIAVNDESLINMFIHADPTDTVSLKEKLSDRCENGKQGTGLLLADRSSLTETKIYALRHCETMSCTVGPGLKDLTDLLLDMRGELNKYWKEKCGEELSPPPKPVLFACENDHAGVKEMGERLNGYIDVVPCMVDRICSMISYSTNENNRTTINVKTEAYPGEIVVMKPHEHFGKDRGENFCFMDTVPFGGPVVRVPELESQATYYTERKFLLVNGGHTVLAFITMIRAQRNGQQFHPPGEFELLNWETMTDEERGKMWAFAVARLLLLTWQYESSVLQDAHNVSNAKDLAAVLLHYAKNTLKRFSAIPDTTKRILAGGVDNRYNGRLKNVEDFLNDAYPASTEVGKEILKQAGISYCAMVTEVHQLVQDAYSFTTEGQTGTPVSPAGIIRLPSLGLIDQLKSSPKHNRST